MMHPGGQNHTLQRVKRVYWVCKHFYCILAVTYWGNMWALNSKRIKLNLKGVLHASSSWNKSTQKDVRGPGPLTDPNIYPDQINLTQIIFLNKGKLWMNSHGKWHTTFFLFYWHHSYVWVRNHVCRSEISLEVLMFQTDVWKSASGSECEWDRAVDLNVKCEVIWAHVEMPEIDQLSHNDPELHWK